MATVKQIEANRRNALKSTGPRTEAGKDLCRRNALIHGLSGAGVVLPEGEAEAVRERFAEWHSSLRPFDAFQTWMLEVVATESLRVEKCRAIQTSLRMECALRAEESWDEDRRREAEEIAAWRTSNPGLACSRLRSTAAGCRLLLDWWTALGRSLEAGGWDPAQEALAMDLLGVPPALRSGAASPLNSGSKGTQIGHRRTIVKDEVERLERMLAEVMPEREERERRAASMGMSAEEGRESLRLRRYEAACMRRLRWAREQISRPQSAQSSTPKTDLYVPRMETPVREEEPIGFTPPDDETDPIRSGDVDPLDDETNPIRRDEDVSPEDETDPFAESPPDFNGDLNTLSDDQIVAAARRVAARNRIDRQVRESNAMLETLGADVRVRSHAWPDSSRGGVGAGQPAGQGVSSKRPRSPSRSGPR